MLKIRNEAYVERTKEAFTDQEYMGFLGAKLHDVGPGTVDIRLPRQPGLTQQHGYFHGGAIGSLADVAGGFAAFTLFAENDNVLTVEYKLNIMAPGKGEMLIARGQVLRPGRQVSVAKADISVLRDGQEHLCATMLGTFMLMADKTSAG